MISTVALIRDIVVAVSSVAVAVVAVLGLNVWRRELAGRAKFELAKRLGILAIRLKAGFRWARMPVTFAGEYAGRERGEKESLVEAKSPG